jgi:hypothetical protein
VQEVEEEVEVAAVADKEHEGGIDDTASSEQTLLASNEHEGKVLVYAALSY